MIGLRKMRKLGRTLRLAKAPTGYERANRDKAETQRLEGGTMSRERA
jgi:hypothetical protein